MRLVAIHQLPRVLVVLMKSAHSAHIKKKTSATPLRSSTLIVHSTMGRAPQDPLLVAAPADTASARSRSRPAVASNRPAWPLNWRNSALSSSCKSCSAVFSPWSSEIPDRGGGGGAAMAAARLRARTGPLGSSRIFFIQAGQTSGQRTCLGFHGCLVLSFCLMTNNDDLTCCCKCARIACSGG